MTALATTPTIDHASALEECQALGYETVAEAENAGLRIWRRNADLRRHYAEAIPRIAAADAIVTGVLVD